MQCYPYLFPISWRSSWRTATKIGRYTAPSLIRQYQAAGAYRWKVLVCREWRSLTHDQHTTCNALRPSVRKQKTGRLRLFCPFPWDANSWNPETVTDIYMYGFAMLTPDLGSVCIPGSTDNNNNNNNKRQTGNRRYLGYVLRQIIVIQEHCAPRDECLFARNG